ncbi:MAG: flagellar hook assembly protein FlgD [Deltaproteobacteria bacterium]|nr:flagellar hook assembly protein FlgD [Deltaproteobacteria bacterium]
MAITNMQSVTGGIATPTQTRTTGNSNLGQADFLKLLVTQLQNQDPTSPMDNQQFIAQMATFSQVQQMTTMNQNLQNIQLLQSSLNNTYALSFIGKSVTATGNQMDLSKDGATAASFSLPSDAKTVSASIFDANGTLVKTINYGAQKSGTYKVAWDGTDNNGKAAANGTYTFTVQAQDEKGGSVAAQTLINGQVGGIKYDPNGTTYLMVGNTKVTISQVQSIN